mgnify:FL=1
MKKFISYYKPHWKLFVIDMICSFLISLCTFAYPFVTEVIMDKENIKAGKFDLILLFCGLLVLIYIIKAILNYVVQYWGHILGVRIQADMRKELFEHLQSLPFSYFDENKTGTIMSRIINDLMDIAELAHHGPEGIFLSIFSIVAATIYLSIRVNPLLAILLCMIIPFVLIFAIVRRKKMKAAFKKMREETGEINARVESSVAGIRVTKAYTASKDEIRKFNESNKAFQKARAKAYHEMGVFNSGMGLFTDIFNAIALVGGALLLYVGLNDKINLDINLGFNIGINEAQLTAYLLSASMIINPIRTLISIFEQIQNGMTGFARFTEIINMKPEKEAENPVHVEGLKEEIRFDKVYFKYSEEENPDWILNGLDLSIKKGKTVALVGPSGGGKTTICHLIPRFYEVSDGAIYFDNVDVRDISFNSLRKTIGIVAQDVFLFTGTIKENIAYGKLDATDEEIIEAAIRANIHDFITGLPEGYNTFIGERGVKLSGGQKQRLSIARAFLKNPEILILDEATSALDNITEMQIQQSLESLSKGRTTIVVAHRLSTVKNADEIIVIDKTGIVERGNHFELIKTNGIYANLYQYQFKE